MSDDTNGHEFLAVVTTVHHQRICETLDDGALGFSEALNGIPPRRVRDVYWGSDLDVITVQWYC